MAVARSQRVEAVVYPSTDNMGEHEVQRLITELLRGQLEGLLRQRGEVAHVGANTFFYWVEGDPSHTYAPDVYVLRGVPQARVEPCWKWWEVPEARLAFALEVVSHDWRKDYEDAPKSCARLGCEELVVFDPHATARSRKRVRWQHYRRDARGALRRVAVRASDRVRVASLNLWLREVRDELGRVRLRVALDDLGNQLVPTDAELRDTALKRAASEAQRAESEAQRAESEAQRAESEAQRAASEAQRAESEAQRAESEAQRAESEAQRAEREALARRHAEEELARLREELTALRDASRRR